MHVIPIFRNVRKRMANKLRISKHDTANGRDKSALIRKGFTLFEVLAAIAVIGIMALIFYPNIMNTLETRKLENSSREILTTMQRAKFQAVKTKLNHRVKFVNEDEGWFFFIEREDDPTQWNAMPGFIRKVIPSQFSVNVNFPDQAVEFSPLGLVSNFSSQQNNITLQSIKLEINNQPHQRIINVFAGGSIQYVKSAVE